MYTALSCTCKWSAIYGSNPHQSRKWRNIRKNGEKMGLTIVSPCPLAISRRQSQLRRPRLLQKPPLLLPATVTNGIRERSTLRRGTGVTWGWRSTSSPWGRWKGYLSPPTMTAASRSTAWGGMSCSRTVRSSPSPASIPSRPGRSSKHFSPAAICCHPTSHSNSMMGPPAKSGAVTCRACCSTSSS